MRSIRLSLLVYILGLETLALGVASVLVYSTARQNLRDKEVATRSMIESKYEQDCGEERRRFDERLRGHAQALARQVQIQVDWASLPLYQAVDAAGTVACQTGPNAHWGLAINSTLKMAGMGPVVFYRGYATRLTLPEGDEGEAEETSGPEAGGHRLETYQIEGDCCVWPLCSSILADRPLPPARHFAERKGSYVEWGSFEPTPGESLRLVRLRSLRVKKVEIFPPWRWNRPGRPPRRDETARPRREEPAVAIVVQYAADTRERDEKLDGLVRQRNADLEHLSQETAGTLGRQQNQLLAISGVTFTATVLGTFCLVWLGLAPLRRLSEAVSKVSPRDFHLPVAGPELPTELRPIAQRLAAALETLERAFAREKQATADISHELRTPLAALLTTLELALRKPRPVEQYREMLRECQLCAQQMNQIIGRLLVLARLDAGVDVVRRQPVDVGALAEQCAGVVRPLAEANGLTLEVHCPCERGDPGRIQTDPDKLREVVNNLLHNAVQYNRPGGRIDVVVALAGGLVEIAVSDTGLGISPQARERVFERFYRADPSRTSDGFNAGLGLSLVKEYVDLLGGTVTVESIEGQGSTFRVRLPARHEASFEVSR